MGVWIRFEHVCQIKENGLQFWRHNLEVEELKIDCTANRLMVQGINMDPMAIKEKQEEKINQEES